MRHPQILPKCHVILLYVNDTDSQPERRCLRSRDHSCVYSPPMRDVFWGLAFPVFLVVTLFLAFVVAEWGRPVV